MKGLALAHAIAKGLTIAGLGIMGSSIVAASPTAAIIGTGLGIAGQAVEAGASIYAASNGTPAAA